jgi:hypothetical protein
MEDPEKPALVMRKEMRKTTQLRIMNDVIFLIHYKNDNTKENHIQ